jgi:hypothetical protein
LDDVVRAAIIIASKIHDSKQIKSTELFKSEKEFAVVEKTILRTIPYIPIVGILSFMDGPLNWSSMVGLLSDYKRLIGVTDLSQKLNEL